MTTNHTTCQICHTNVPRVYTTDIGPIGQIIPACDSCYRKPEVQALAAFHATPSYVEQQAAAFAQEFAMCPFCPILLPDSPEMWQKTGRDFFGKPVQVGNVACCDASVEAVDPLIVRDALRAISYVIRRGGPMVLSPRVHALAYHALGHIAGSLSRLCSCHYYTCSYCGNCHNPRCPHYGPCNQV